MAPPPVLVVHVLLLVVCVLLMLLSTRTAQAAEQPDSASAVRLSRMHRTRIVARARLERYLVRRYAGEWLPTSGYPMGDVASDRGACTDLVVRALRTVGIDLQRLVHEDILAEREAYRLRRADWTIDHRRASTLFVWFQRHAPALSLDPSDTADFQPGDVVFFGPSRTTPQFHVAIVSDRKGPRGLPLIIENGGPLPVESDSLDARPILGHFQPAVLPTTRHWAMTDVLEALIGN